MMDRIASAQNEKFKSWKSLKSSKGIKEEGSYLVEGKKLIQEYLQSPDWIRCALISSEEFQIEGIRNYILDSKLLNELSDNGQSQVILVCRAPEIKEYTAIQENTLFLPLSDPNNLGACLRSALAFGFRHIVLLEEAAHPCLPKAVRAASAALIHLQFYKGPSIQNLSSNILALDMKGMTIEKLEASSYYHLLVGEEGQGIPPQFQNRICLSMSRESESLNATVATSIAMYELIKKQRNR